MMNQFNCKGLIVHNSKECFKCNQVKPLSEFYVHKQMADGHLNKCKECTKTDTKKNYRENIDYYIEYNRSRSMLPKSIARRERYLQTEAGKIAARRSKSKWACNNVIKKAASCLVSKNVKSGKIIKPSICSECGNKSAVIHGHHDDYAFPLSVRWLCPKCHTEWHKANGEAKNG